MGSLIHLCRPIAGNSRTSNAVPILESADDSAGAPGPCWRIRGTGRGPQKPDGTGTRSHLCQSITGNSRTSNTVPILGLRTVCRAGPPGLPCWRVGAGRGPQRLDGTGLDRTSANRLPEIRGPRGAPCRSWVWGRVCRAGHRAVLANSRHGPRAAKARWDGLDRTSADRLPEIADLERRADPGSADGLPSGPQACWRNSRHGPRGRKGLDGDGPRSHLCQSITGNSRTSNAMPILRSTDWSAGRATRPCWRIRGTGRGPQEPDGTGLDRTSVDRLPEIRGPRTPCRSWVWRTVCRAGHRAVLAISRQGPTGPKPDAAGRSQPAFASRLVMMAPLMTTVARARRWMSGHQATADMARLPVCELLSLTHDPPQRRVSGGVTVPRQLDRLTLGQARSIARHTFRLGRASLAETAASAPGRQ